jgi:hypothetical protein
MAASLVIEQEWGTTKAHVNRHNGYWAGDFSGPRQDTPRNSWFD